MFPNSIGHSHVVKAELATLLYWLSSYRSCAMLGKLAHHSLHPLLQWGGGGTHSSKVFAAVGPISPTYSRMMLPKTAVRVRVNFVKRVYKCIKMLVPNGFGHVLYVLYMYSSLGNCVLFPLFKTHGHLHKQSDCCFLQLSTPYPHHFLYVKSKHIYLMYFLVFSLFLFLIYSI
jgi:hypothetical protein